MSLFEKFKAGLARTQSKLTHEIKRIVTRSPRLDANSLEELEAALLGADLGAAMTAQIVGAVRTPVGKRNGSYAGVHPADMSAYVLRALAAMVLPGHSPRRYWLHARQALAPGRGEGIREAAEAYNRSIGP